jgi:predicted HD superfamily hydrolase involved in NAD metabolism
MTHKRLLHVLGVTHTLAALAAGHGLGVERGALTGLLHDQSKEFTPEAIRKDLERWGVEIPPEDLDHPKVWHGLHAAHWARVELGVEDPEVLEAVTLHTTSDADAGPLTRAIYVSDFCEPGRSNPEAPAIRRIARDDLDEAYRRVLAAKTRHMLARRGFVLHPRSRRALVQWLPAQVLGELGVAEPAAETSAKTLEGEGS